jgi:hypothetical protein
LLVTVVLAVPCSGQHVPTVALLFARECRTMRLRTAYLDGAAMFVFMLAVVLTIVYLLDYAGVIRVIPSFLR